jgi:hypothetical protein
MKPMATQQPVKQALYKRRGAHITLAMLAIIFSLTLVLMPLGINHLLKQWIETHGNDRVSIENIDFNPFTATLSLHQLQARKGDAITLSINKLDLQLAWHPLWNRHIVVEAARLKGAKLLIDQRDDASLKIGGISLDAEQPIKSTDTKTAWQFSLNRLEIITTSIEYRDTQINSRLHIEEFLITSLSSFSPQQPAVLNLQGKLDDASIKLQGELLAFTAGGGFEGSLNIQDLSFTPYASLAEPALNQLQGTATISSHISIQQQPKGQISLTQDGEIALHSFQFSTAGTQFRNKEFNWQGKFQYQNDAGSIHTKLTGDLNLEDSHILLPDQQLEIQQGKFNWSGDSEISLPAKGTALITIKGVVRNSQFKLLAPQDDTELSYAQLSWDGSTTTDIDNATGSSHTKLTGNLKLDDSHIFFPDQQLAVQQHKFNWSGDSEISLPARGATLITINGIASNSQFKLSAPQRDTELSYVQLKWDGSTTTNIDDEFNSLTINGNLDIQDLKAISPGKNYTLMQFTSLQASTINGQFPQQVTAPDIQFNNLTLGQQGLTEDTGSPHVAAALAHYGKLVLENTDYSEKEGLSIKAIKLTNATQLNHKDRDGNWDRVRLVDIIKSAAESDNVKSTNKENMRIRVGSISVHGDSNIVYLDDQQDPAFRQNINISQGVLENLDTHSPNQPSPLILKGITVDHANVSIKGTVSPFAEKLTLDLKGNIEGLPLPPFSSYSRNLLGYKLDSGELDATIQLKAIAGELSGENQLTFHQLEVTPLNKDEAIKKETDAGTSLETGLAMLRDKHNTISLNIPVSGNVDNFKVDPGDAINQALGTAIKFGAKTYLSAALFPYGTILTLVQIAGEQAAKVQLEPVLYAPGSAELTDKSMEYLSKIPKILEERPEIYIKLCGVATEADRGALKKPATPSKKVEKSFWKKIFRDKDKSPENKPEVSIVSDEQLMALAKARAAKIEQYLHEEYGVKTNRLISCQPRIDIESEKPEPRTDLLI